VVGGSTPDLSQLGNTWIPEFAALHAVEPLDEWVARSSVLAESCYFRGIWDTNVVDGKTWGIPWYVDTRVLFYRTDVLARAGFDSIPGSWAEWTRVMQAITRTQGPGHYALFLPTNEYTPWIIFGIQAGSSMLSDDATRGAFSAPAFRRSIDFELDLFKRGLAPSMDGGMIANRYQEFERGMFSMYISGPWDVGEFGRRLSPAMRGRWSIAPLPGPDGPASGASIAGGSSLVMYRNSRHKAEAWRLVEFLSRPDQQLRFRQLCGNLPARIEAWSDTSMTNDPYSRVFERQLLRAVSQPKVPEWENISLRLRAAEEAIVLGHTPPDTALRALDHDVDEILEKRRWLVDRARRAPRAGVRS
jgi:multiple sugar transport system substrate-binding protein